MPQIFRIFSLFAFLAVASLTAFARIDAPLPNPTATDVPTADSQPSSTSSGTQTPAAHLSTYYMEITGTFNPTSGSISVAIDLGKTLGRITGLSTADMRRLSQNLQFSSMVDAMNFLSKLGWRLIDTYTVTSRNITTIHWVAAKDVSHPSQLLDGLAERL